jgi:hypothetical protein
MPQTQARAISNCPNPKCNKPIPIDHPYTWCGECGVPLPEDIKAQIPRLEKALDTSLAAGDQIIAWCPFCGKAVDSKQPDRLTLCPHCGEQLPHEITARHGFSGVLFWILVVMSWPLRLVGTVGIGATLIPVLGGKANDPDMSKSVIGLLLGSALFGIGYGLRAIAHRLDSKFASHSADEIVPK